MSERTADTITMLWFSESHFLIFSLFYEIINRVKERSSETISVPSSSEFRLYRVEHRFLPQTCCGDPSIGRRKIGARILFGNASYLLVK